MSGANALWVWVSDGNAWCKMDISRWSNAQSKIPTWSGDPLLTARTENEDAYSMCFFSGGVTVPWQAKAVKMDPKRRFQKESWRRTWLQACPMI